MLTSIALRFRNARKSQPKQRNTRRFYADEFSNHLLRDMGLQR